jgi:Uma2 family endonuclease
MSMPERRPATYEDLLLVPDTKVAEIINGDLIVSPRPGGPHAISASIIGMGLGPPFNWGQGGPGGWWIIDEPELHLNGNVLVPDLAGWRKERLPVYPADPFVTLAPDWVCEVVSESTARIDRIRKLPIYAAFEVRHAWLVDPLKQTLEVYRLEGTRWSLLAAHEGDEEVRAEPFEAVVLPLKRLWDRGES